MIVNLCEGRTENSKGKRRRGAWGAGRDRPKDVKDVVDVSKRKSFVS